MYLLHASTTPAYDFTWIGIERLGGMSAAKNNISTYIFRVK